MRLSTFILTSFLGCAAIYAAPVPIFDGKTMAGWEGDAKWWKVEDGMIVGGSLTKEVDSNYFVASTKSYANFDLKLKLKITGTGFVNSGVQIRSVRLPGSSEMYGYQVDAGDGWWGKLYDESRRNKVLSDSKDPKAVEAAVKKGDWNEYRIRTDGAHIQSWINGVPALDYVEADPKIAQDGAIGVQIHAGGKAQVQIKDVTIEELPATPNAPTWDKVGRPGDNKPKTAQDYNASGGAAKTPAEEQALFKVPDGFEVELVAAEEPGIAKFIATTFDQQGRLWTMTALEYPVDGNENPAGANALYANPATKDKVLVYDRDPASPTGFVKKPRVFAEGLAIPLGLLPYGDGCYVLHGHDILRLHDTDGDGKADKQEVILTGFGVQDSHLFPHQFTRAPGGWIWMAQGAFNYSKVLQPGQPPEKAIKFDQTRMARFKPDGSGFDITSNGPCNIWGLVMGAEGECFIQEANDYGYPVMPFHEYGNYPGCSNGQWKSYAPEFPGTPNMLLGGTGLSGLALTDAKGMYPAPWADVMLVANPITRKINAIKMHRDGPRWKLEKLPDFVDSTDPMFRPVAIAIGPDGCLYITDWYNKVISHNEVPRTHPDRDKTHGRIWRVKAKAQKPWEIPNFTKLTDEELLAKLGGESVTQSHIAWQTIVDRKASALIPKLKALVESATEPAPRRIAALWALEGLPAGYTADLAMKLVADPNRNIRREAVRAISNVADVSPKLSRTQPLLACLHDADPEVRAQVIRSAGTMLEQNDTIADEVFPILFQMAKGPIEGPTMASTSTGKKIKIGEAYDCEFERYLVRMFLEKFPGKTASFLASPEGGKLSVEARLLATLALEPKKSAAGVAKLLPQLTRPPGKEEILRLLEFLGEPGVAEAVKAALANPATSPAVLGSLVELRTRLDAGKVAPLVNDAAKNLLAGDAQQVDLGIKLVSAFKMGAMEPQLVALVENPKAPGAASAALKALGEIGSANSALFVRLIKNSADTTIREEALAGLANSKAADAAQQIFSLWPSLTPVQRKFALSRLVSTKTAASAVVAAVKAGTIAKTDIDAALLDRLQAILPDDPAMAAMIQDFGALFRPILALDGSEEAWTLTNLTLDGPMTVESWVRLDPVKGKASAESGIFGAPNGVDLNFFDTRFRVYVFGLGDVAISKKTVTPNFWTHFAATRDAAGLWKIYIDGQLDATATRPALKKLENPRIGWTSAPGGTRGAFANFRVWNRERTGGEISANFNRGLPDNTPGLVLNAAADTGWGTPEKGARVAKTADIPPLLTAEEAVVLDAKFAKIRVLAEKGGDPAKGKLTAMICQACHLIGNQGGQIGPNLSGAGAMGTEALLNNIITPNAAMESAYRIFRIELKDGSIKEGFQAGEDKDAFVLRLPGVEDQRIAKKDIRSTAFIRRSLMPEGLLDGLSPEQVSDLFAYLKTLK